MRRQSPEKQDSWENKPAERQWRTGLWRDTPLNVLSTICPMRPSRDVLPGTVPKRCWRSAAYLKPLRCYQCNYLWPDGKCVHEVESLSLCVQFTNVQSIAGSFSTVCPSSTHTFRLLLEMKRFRSRESHLSLEYNNIKILGMSGAERDFITQLHTCKMIFLGPNLQALLLTP